MKDHYADFLAWIWEEPLCGSLHLQVRYNKTTNQSGGEILLFCMSTAVSWNGLTYLEQ